MEATAIARSLLEPIPANTLLGVRVDRAVDGAATVGLAVRPELTNVVDALHASGLLALVDAAGLAAVLSAAERADQLVDVLPLGSDADLCFYAPARGELTAHCELDDGARELAREFFAARSQRLALMTETQIVDSEGSVVCTGRFRWRIRRKALVGAGR